MTWTINDTVIDLDLRFYLLFYVLIAIHELGHVMASKFIGGNVTLIEFGAGTKWFSLRKLQINKYFFVPKGCVWSKYRQSFWNGVIFYSGSNLLLVIVCILINLFFLKSYPEIVAQLNLAGVNILAFTSIPMRYPNGLPNDGLSIYNLIKQRKKHSDKPVL